MGMWGVIASAESRTPALRAPNLHFPNGFQGFRSPNGCPSPEKPARFARQNLHFLRVSNDFASKMVPGTLKIGALGAPNPSFPYSFPVAFTLDHMKRFCVRTQKKVCTQKRFLVCTQKRFRLRMAQLRRPLRRDRASSRRAR